MHILLVEDDLALASFLERGLELERHTVTHAANGEAGLAQALAGDFDCIVLDLNLPRLDGWQVLHQLRSSGVGKPIIMLTGRSSVEERIRCLDAGADDFLVKPFSFFELTARCRAMQRRQSAQTVSATIRHGVLGVDRLARRVFVHDEEVVLTAKEYALLDYLLQHRPRPVGRPELLENVWKMAPDAGTNVVDVYVNYLRRKLRVRPEDGELIVTVRGSGYALATSIAKAESVARKPVVADVGMMQPIRQELGRMRAA